MARNNYAKLLFKTFRYREALAEIDKAIAAEPNRASHRRLKASILARIGEAEAAIDIYKRVLERYPAQPRTRMSMGHALKTPGRQADTIAAYQEDMVADTEAEVRRMLDYLGLGLLQD